jgi:hypothetical protein
LSPNVRTATGEGETIEPPPRRDIHVVSPQECAMSPPRPYVIKGILSQGDHAGLIGLPGSAKSALAPFVGYRVALGLDVFGHRTRPMTVLYIAAEDGAGMKQRVRALYELMGDAPGFFLQPVPVDFLDPSSRHTVEIEELIRRLRPGLVILDTIARAFPGLAENDPDKMGLVVKVLRGFTMICNSAVLSLHHPPKDSVTPRGHGVLNGDLDLTLYLQGERGQPRTVTMGKNRSGPSDLTFTFSLTSYQLGVDIDGDPITAPVVEPTAKDATAARNSAKEGRLRDAPTIMLRELRTLLETDAELVQPAPELPALMAVKRVLLRKRLIDRGWFPDSVVRNAPDGKTELERGAYKMENKALTTLKRNAFVGHTRDWAWSL